MYNGVSVRTAILQQIEIATARISFNAFADTILITLTQLTNTRHSLFIQNYHNNQREIDHDGHYVTCKAYS